MSMFGSNGARPSKEFLQERFPTRKFDDLGRGSVWDVFTYSHQGEDGESDYVVKRFINYMKAPALVDMESAKEIAERLKKERDYLHEKYDNILPYLIRHNKIVISNSQDQAIPEILSVQEKLTEVIDLSYPELVQGLESDERESLLNELRIFVERTKSLLHEKDAKVEEMNGALPDLAVLSNLAITEVDGDKHLVLLDTNFVLPVDDTISRQGNMLERIAYNMIFLEVHYLGKSPDSLEGDTFYGQVPHILRRVKRSLSNVPRMSYEVLKSLNLHGGPDFTDRVRERQEPIQNWIMKLVVLLEEMPEVHQVKVLEDDLRLDVFVEGAQLTIDRVSGGYEYSVQVSRDGLTKTFFVPSDKLEEFVRQVDRTNEGRSE